MAEIVLDPAGIVHGGKTHPPGTPAEELKGSDGHLRAWRHLKQIGEAPAPAVDPAAGGVSVAVAVTPKLPPKPVK